MDKLTARLELKMREDTMQGLQEIYQKHRLTPAEVCRALAEGAVEYFRKNGRFGFPIILSEESRPPTSPVTINPSTNQSENPFPPAPKKHSKKKISKAQLDGRRLSSAGRGRVMRGITELHDRINSAKPTAEGARG